MEISAEQKLSKENAVEDTVEKSTQEIAVIGCNLSALMALATLNKFNNFHLTWALAPKESFDPGKGISILLPEQAVAHLPEHSESRKLIEPVIFHNSHRHERLSEFLRQPQTSFSKSLPTALRQKIESICLWNDVTPLPVGHNGEINFHWTSQDPDSFTNRKEKKFYLINRTELLKHSAKSSQFNLFLHSLSLDQGDTKDKLKVIFKAPNAWKAFDAILWTSQQIDPKVERGSSLKLKERVHSSHALWRSFTTTVPEHLINALPEASLWIPESNAANHFLKTGDICTGCILRVLKPTPTTLQIDILEMSSDPFRGPRPDSCLWTFAPLLRESNIQWSSCVLDENLIYDTPFPVLHSFRQGFDFWSGGPFSNLARTIELKALWAKHKSLTPS